MKVGVFLLHKRNKMMVRPYRKKKSCFNIKKPRNIGKNTFIKLVQQ